MNTTMGAPKHSIKVREYYDETLQVVLTRILIFVLPTNQVNKEIDESVRVLSSFCPPWPYSTPFVFL